MSSTDHSRVINFGAGPSALPVSVLEEAAQGLLNFQGTGIGIAEISHRSKEFTEVVNELESLIRTQLDVPSTHTILFTQGGGSSQFSAVVLNMLARYKLLHPGVANEDVALDYVLTGSWSKKAADEAKRLGGGKVNIVVDAREHSKDGKSFDNIPPHEAFKFSPDPALIYYCENETVDGVEFSHDLSSPTAFPFHLLPQNTLLPLVADYSSSFMCRPIPRLADHAIIYAGAQKNIGPAGLTVLIVRHDCIVDVDAAVTCGATPVPIMLSYKTLADSKSLYNTPSVISVYMTKLVLERMNKLGGVKYFEELNRKKAEKMYALVKEGEEKGVFRRKVKEGSESWMNVVFDVLGDGAEKRFLEGAEKQGMKGLKGHRSVGGIRISLYNAITEDDTDKLEKYIKEFIEQETAAKNQPNA
ncbi:phosphoserine aminotransferase [Panus rudis PR-1116 ss-1]|nr:phosphoserine aminotransferase [Panus rudis PR-1116 ss-1]